MADPTVIFTISVILTPTIFCADFPAIVTYLTTPSLLLSFAVTAAVVFFTRSGPCATLSPLDRRIAYWFLMNGVYFNFFLDVIAGQFQLMGEMTKQYKFVEPRYALGPMSDAGAPVFITSMLEMFAHAPIGVFAYIAFNRKWPQRYLAAFTVSLLHSVGVCYFYVPEVINGFRNLGGWPKDMDEALSFHRLVFFWFGFWFCGFVWIIVPAIIAHHSWHQISKSVAVADNTATKGSNGKKE